MVYNRKTRRQFLFGAGKTLLALPFLPSLLPREAWGANLVKAPHFVGINGFNGQWKRHFLPTPGFWENALTQRGSMSTPGGTITASGRSLSEIAGDISPILKAFNAYKNQMNILYNLSLPGDGHNPASTTTASNNGNSGVVEVDALWKNSIDQVFARSPIFYPNGFPARNLASLVVADPGHSYYYHSYYGGASVPPSDSTKSLWDNILKVPFSQAGGGTFVVTPGKDARVRALNAVFNDYKNAKSPIRNISSLDSQRLESFMTLMSEAAAEYDKGSTQPVTMTATCLQPNVNEVNSSGANAQASWNTNFKLIAAAFQCGISNSAGVRIRLGSDNGDPTAFHNASHLSEAQDGPNQTLVFHQWVAARIKVLIDELARLPDIDGQSLLSNSCVVWSNEMGFDSYLFGPNDHSGENLPVVTFGGLGGKLRTGEMLRFDSSRGANFRLSYNTVLETVMQAAGVTNYPTRTLTNSNGATIQGFGMQGESYKAIHYANTLPYWRV